MPALEPLLGIRAVADPTALDGAFWPAGTFVLRIAPDEVLVVGHVGADIEWLEPIGYVIDDPHAIVEIDRGYVGAVCSAFDRPQVEAHADWPIPHGDGRLAQGKVAGVPVKIWAIGSSPGTIQLDGDDFLLVTHTAYAAELRGRLGW